MSINNLIPFGSQNNIWEDIVSDSRFIIYRTGVISLLLAETKYDAWCGGSDQEIKLFFLQNGQKHFIEYIGCENFKTGEDPLGWEGEDFLKKFPALGGKRISAGIGYLCKIEKPKNIEKDIDLKFFLLDIFEWPDKSSSEYIPKNGVWILDNSGKIEAIPAEKSLLDLNNNEDFPAGKILEKLAFHLSCNTNLYYFFVEKQHNFSVPCFYALEMGLMPIINSGQWSYS